MQLDMAALGVAVDAAMTPADPDTPSSGIEVGALVLSWDLERPVEYGGVDEHAATSNGLVYVVGRGKGGMTVLCQPEMVAPANTTLAHPKDPRIQVDKTAPSFHGTWRMGLPGRRATWHKTRREAVAAGQRRLAIIDWHARQRHAAGDSGA